MQALIHLGLNKCASTYVQAALQASRRMLAEAGGFVPDAGDHLAQYDLSRQYGFGPVAPEVIPSDIQSLFTAAQRDGAHWMILSSEYLSLYNPAGVQAFCADLSKAGIDARFLIFSRSFHGWLRALFNQYVKTVEGGPALPGLDAFADQVLRNRAVDIARRVRQWQDAIDARRLELYRLPKDGMADAALQPFDAFTGRRLVRPAQERLNASLDVDRLHAVGLLRAEAPSKARTRQIEALLSRQAVAPPAPPGYMTLSAQTERRLRDEIIKPCERLPWRHLTVMEGAGL